MINCHTMGHLRRRRNRPDKWGCPLCNDHGVSNTSYFSQLTRQTILKVQEVLHNLEPETCSGKCILRLCLWKVED